MPATEFATIHELRAQVGQEIAVTDWLEVTQQRINQFAEATGDHQWIHLDTERAKQESPFGTTIAHGFLTLSLLSYLMSQAVVIRSGVKMGINYGLNRVRFTSPVPSGANIHARVKLLSVDDIKGGVQAAWEITVECEGATKPSCIAEWLVRYYE